MIDLYHLTRTFKTFGSLNRAFIDQVGDDWFVYASSSKYKRNVNTHVCATKQEALANRDAINKHLRK